MSRPVLSAADNRPSLPERLKAIAALVVGEGLIIADLERRLEYSRNLMTTWDAERYRIFDEMKTAEEREADAE